MLRRFIAVIAVAFAALLIAPMSAAFADNCFNLSRPSGDLSSNPADFTQPVFKGGWVWLPYCDAGGALNPDGTRRQDTHGVQSFCGAV